MEIIFLQKLPDVGLNLHLAAEILKIGTAAIIGHIDTQ